MFDTPTRNKLATFVGKARKLLCGDYNKPGGEITSLLQTYGIQPDGSIADLEGVPGLDQIGYELGQTLRDNLAHKHAQGPTKKTWGKYAAAVYDLLQEQSFTVLNRLCALRMAEERGLILPCVSKGMESDGFELYEQITDKTRFDRETRYQHFLFSIFDELAIDLGVLFDRFSPNNLLFPRPEALGELLALLNNRELASIWSEDETIGWIYQYYNDPEERRKMRDVKQGGSAAPRNSREMAVRNQFFTPRYVVEFLTDNALGRLWYEMTQGKTSLKDSCRYLIKRPVELFLPGPDITIWHDAEGIDAFRRFSASASPHDLPEDPVLGVLMGWIFHTRPDGFEKELREIGRTHQEVIDEILVPLEQGRDSERLASAPSLELLHVIWRLSQGFHSSEYGTPMAPVSEDLVAGPVWKTLRENLLHPPENLSKEDQLRQPVFIPHRPLKDPRQIRLIDPACGSMHFGLYAFDLLEIIYQEAWEMGIVPGVDFGQDTPPFSHSSVRLKPGLARIHSNDTHQDIDAATARVVMLKTNDAGDGMFHCGPYLAEPGRSYRPGTTWEIPFADFDYQKCFAENRFAEEEGERFIRETKGNWDYDRADPLTQEEAHAQYLRRVPSLILEHNIHGIDIDPRAAQIAGLALWLRAQKAWQQQGLSSADRPTVTRSNIVCAEAMPGEEDLLLRFVERSFPSSERPFFTKLLGEIFKTMRLAGEAGSLLKIEDDVSALVADARAQWKKIGKKDGDFFSQVELVNLDRRTILQQPIDTGSWSLDALSGIPDSQFWEKAEERIYDALRTFAESAEGNYQRRLFADDAAHGFAFIDLCRQRYDVALMNPPFGDGSMPSKSYLDATYGDTKGDVYKAFVECFQARLVPAGYLGIISSRTGFFLSMSEDWRTRVVLRLFRPIAIADLGMGVLDAMVEVAAYVLRNLSESETRDLTHSIVPTLEKVIRDKQDRFSLPKWQSARDGLKRYQAMAELEHLEAEGFVTRDIGEIIRFSPNRKSVKAVTLPHEPIFPSLMCVRALADTDKAALILNALNEPTSAQRFACDPSTFAAIPSSPFAYWTSPALLGLGLSFPSFDPTYGGVKVGVQTDNDLRFVRLGWELPSDRIENSKSEKWILFLKDDSSSSFYDDVTSHLNWACEGHELKAFVSIGLGGGHWSRRIINTEFFYKPGISWALRTSRFSPACVPSGCIFSVSRYLAVPENCNPLAVVAIWNSALLDYLCKLRMERHGHPKFIVGVVRNTPFPKLSSVDEALFADLALRAWSQKRFLKSGGAISHAFVIPSILSASGTTLLELASNWRDMVGKGEQAIATIQDEIDKHAFRVFGLNGAAREDLTISIESSEGVEEEDSEEEMEQHSVGPDASALIANLLDYALGAAFGRWDLRFATGEKTTPPEPDPFDPLPVCPPGMLQNGDGFPATPADVPDAYPLRISWPGILVDDDGHPEDIETRVREVLAVVFPDRRDEIAHEACEILGVKTLRDFFDKPTAFFAGHLKRHSKNRRQAPLYWPLSTASGSYTLWIYYHRFTNDTLYAAVSQFVEPKIEEARRTLARLHEKGDARTKPEDKTYEQTTQLVGELATFREELLRIAGFWKPNLNDGVQITAAPLWSLFRLKPWQTKLKNTWQQLEKGDFDWAHLAYSIRPKEVITKCATDRSLAIAHGHEADLWEEVENAKGKLVWQPKEDSESIIEGLLKNH